MVLSHTNPLYDDVPLNEPPFPYSSDLGFYDKLMSSPSDSTRQWAWFAYMLVAGVATVIILLVFTSIVVNKEVRSKPFNLYLLYLMIPDFIFSGSCAITCAINMANHHYVSIGMCKFQSFYLGFGATANVWINGFIALEIYKMLRDSYQRKRYFPPTLKKVSITCGCIYLLSVGGAAVGALNFTNSPVQGFLHIGATVCSPSTFDRQSTLVYYLAFMFVMFGIPTNMVMFATFEIMYRGYLPPKGNKKRILALYFFRLIVVFAIFWIPGIIMFEFLAGWFSPVVAIFGALLGHFQGIVSVLVSLQKDDVRKCFMAFVNRLLCRPVDDDAKERMDRQGSTATFAMSAATLELTNSVQSGAYAVPLSTDSIRRERASHVHRNSAVLGLANPQSISFETIADDMSGEPSFLYGDDNDEDGAGGDIVKSGDFVDGGDDNVMIQRDEHWVVDEQGPTDDIQTSDAEKLSADMAPVQDSPQDEEYPSVYGEREQDLTVGETDDGVPSLAVNTPVEDQPHDDGSTMSDSFRDDEEVGVV